MAAKKTKQELAAARVARKIAQIQVLVAEATQIAKDNKMDISLSIDGKRLSFYADDGYWTSSSDHC